METIPELLKEGKTLLSDGATGTELQKRGLPAGDCPEEFNISKPEIIKQIHLDYLAAGSDIIETNTFGGNRARLKLHNYENRVKEFNAEAVKIAKDVCPDDKFVAGSVGPTGEILEPLGTLSEKEAYDMFAEQVSALAEAGVNIIFVETMMAIEEAVAALKAAKENCSLPVSVTMTFENGNAGLRTMWGVDVKTAVESLAANGADIIGANCGKGFDEMIEIVKEMRPLTEIPILAQANAGIPEWVHGVSVYTQTPEFILPKAEKLLDLGVNIIGGCCGTGPEHIKAIRKLLDKRYS